MIRTAYYIKNQIVGVEDGRGKGRAKQQRNWACLVERRIVLYHYAAARKKEGEQLRGRSSSVTLTLPQEEGCLPGQGKWA